MRRTVVTLGIALVGFGFSGLVQAQDLPAFCGPGTLSIEAFMLSASDYSNLK